MLAPRRRRNLRLSAVALSAVWALGPACRQESGPRTCALELAAPAYPSIAYSARVTLKGIQAVVQIKRGEIDSIQQIYPDGGTHLRFLFANDIETAVRRSKFGSACGDRVETIVYDFVGPDPAYRDPADGVRTSFVPPNRIVVASTGVSVQFSTSPK
jgi:hypothetical protein